MKLSLRIEERDLLKFELKNLLIYITDHMVVEGYKGENKRVERLEGNKKIVEGLLEKLLRTEKNYEKIASRGNIPRNSAEKSTTIEGEKTQSPS